MPPKPNNPAARLYLILSEARSRNPQATIGQVWAYVLNTDDDGKLWSRVGLIYGLPREIQKQLQHRPDYDAHEMAWWEPLSRGLAYCGSREKWSGVQPAITDDALAAIRSCARKLNHSFPESILEESTIEELRSYISEIRDGMADEPTDDEDLANFLSQRLERMEDLLDDIKIVGAVGVKQSVETVVSEVNSKSEEIKETLTPQAWDRWECLLGRVRTVFATVAVVSGALGSGVMTVKALTSGAPQLENTQEQSQTEHELPSSIPKPEPKTQDDDAGDDFADADFKEI